MQKVVLLLLRNYGLLKESVNNLWKGFTSDKHNILQILEKSSR